MAFDEVWADRPDLIPSPLEANPRSNYACRRSPRPILHPIPRSHKTSHRIGFCKQSVAYLSARAFGSITQCIALSDSPKAGALVGWFGGEERLESFIPDGDGAVDA